MTPTEMFTSWDYRLIALSVIIAIIGSYVALDFAGRMKSAEDNSRRLWFIVGALAMGLAIWSMHFVGMLALIMPMPVTYDEILSALSILAATTGSGIAFAIMNRKTITPVHFVMGSIAMGLAIVTMHYTGMASMRMQATIHYNPVLFVLSVIIAITASAGALWLAFNLKRDKPDLWFYQKLGSAFVMGFAIAGMHYTGMAAATYYHIGTVVSGMNAPPTVGAFKLSDLLIAASVIFGLALLTLGAHAAGERQRVLKRLQESEERFRIMADSAPVAIFVTDTEPKNVYVNKGWLEYTGLTHEAALGLTWYEVVHPEDLKPYLDNFLFAFDQRIDFRAEVRIRRPNGNYGWILASATPRYTTDGEFLGYIGTGVDITDRKKAESALRESEERFRTMADASPMFVCMVDKTGRLTYANQRILEFTKQSYEDILATGWEPFIHPDDHHLVEEALKNALKPNGRYEVEFRCRRYDGQYRWMLSTGLAVLDTNGELIGLINSSIDITERKQTFERERLLRRVTEIINQSFDLNDILNMTAQEIGAFFQVDRAYVIRYQQVENYLNINLYGQYYRSPDVPRIDMSDFPPHLFKTLTQNLPIEEAMRPQRFTNPDIYLQDIKRRMFQLSHLSEQEKAEYVDYFKRILIDKYCTHAMLRVGVYYRGIPYGVITLQQCQSREWLNDEVDLLNTIATHIGVAFYQSDLFIKEQKARQVAEIANQRKSQFLATMSHELRTPLNAVIGYGEMLEGGIGGKLNDKQLRYIHNVTSSGRHLLDMVNDILDVSKIEAGKMALSLSPVNIDTLIDTLKGLFQEQAQQKQVQLIFDIQPGIHEIEADPARLKQIFINLISNAIKFNTIGGHVFVRLYRLEESGSQWLLGKVEDTGIGIPQEKLPELFTDFYQIDNTPSREYEGTGLGLALTKRLVELHGGHIDVESIEGSGSTFTFKLPAKILSGKATV